MLWFMLLYMSVVGVVSGLSRAELANFLPTHPPFTFLAGCLQDRPWQDFSGGGCVFPPFVFYVQELSMRDSLQELVCALCSTALAGCVYAKLNSVFPLLAKRKALHDSST